MTSTMSPFDRLPDELLENIFLSVRDLPSLTTTNHVRISPDSLYFDYSIQQPLLKKIHTDLISSSLVCRRFYRILKSPDFWERKCRYDYVLLPTQFFPSDFTAYEKLFINNPLHPSFNLVEENQWRKSDCDSRIEFVPGGSYPLYDEFNRLSSCRVTSYSWAHFFQRNVQLLGKTLSWNDVACLHPIIEFSVCVAARWDCGSQCRVCLVFSDGHRWECERIFPQWNDKKWHRLTYHYKQYKDFPKSVTVHLSGKDTQFWAGFYGVKFAQTRLRMLFHTDGNETNQESETIIEPNVEDENIQHAQRDPVPDNLPLDNQDDDFSEKNSPTYHSRDSDTDSDND